MPRLGDDVGRVLGAIWPASVGALAVVYANVGAGDWARRSAIGWMMGSWGARLTVQALYAPGARDLSKPTPVTSYFGLLTSAAFFSMPAAFASLDVNPSLTTLELAASALWVIAFAAQTTADRQFLRFVSNPGHAGVVCRSGLWRYSSHAHAMFEVLIWVAFALFASASPWGWLALACVPARVALLLARTDPGT